MAFAFTDKDGHLNKAHGLHLEARLLDLAREARRFKLDNQQQGRSISLSEVDRAEAEGYLRELLLCCPVLGLRVFERPLAPPVTASPTATSGPASAPVLFQLRGRMPKGAATSPPVASRCSRVPGHASLFWTPALIPWWLSAGSSPSRVCSPQMARA